MLDMNFNISHAPWVGLRTWWISWSVAEDIMKENTLISTQAWDIFRYSEKLLQQLYVDLHKWKKRYLIKYPSTFQFIERINEFARDNFAPVVYVLPNTTYEERLVEDQKETPSIGPWVRFTTLKKFNPDEQKKDELVVFIDYTSASQKEFWDTEVALSAHSNVILHSTSPEFIRSRVSGEKYSVISVKRKELSFKDTSKIVVEPQEWKTHEECLSDAFIEKYNPGEKWYFYCQDQDQVDQVEAYIWDTWAQDIIYYVSKDLKDDCFEREAIVGIVFFGKFSLQNTTKGFMAGLTSVSENPTIVIDMKERQVRTKDYLRYGLDDLGLSRFRECTEDWAWRNSSEMPNTVKWDDTVTIGSVFDRLDKRKLDEDSDRTLLDNAKNEFAQYEWDKECFRIQFLYFTPRQRLDFLKKSIPSYAKILKRQWLFNTGALWREELLDCICNHLCWKEHKEKEYVTILWEYFAANGWSTYWELLSEKVKDFFKIPCVALRFFAVKKKKNLSQLDSWDQKEILQKVFWQWPVRQKNDEIRNTLKDELGIEDYIDLLLYGNDIRWKSIKGLRKVLRDWEYFHAFLLLKWVNTPSALTSEQIPFLGKILWNRDFTQEKPRIKSDVALRSKKDLARLNNKTELFFPDLLDIPHSSIARSMVQMPYLQLYLKFYIYNDGDKAEGKFQFKYDVKRRLIDDLFPVGAENGDWWIQRRFADPERHLDGMLDELDISSLEDLFSILQEWDDEEIKKLISKSERFRKFAQGANVVWTGITEYTWDSIVELERLLRETFIKELS